MYFKGFTRDLHPYLVGQSSNPFQEHDIFIRAKYFIRRILKRFDKQSINLSEFTLFSKMKYFVGLKETLTKDVPQEFQKFEIWIVTLLAIY